MKEEIAGVEVFRSSAVSREHVRAVIPVIRESLENEGAGIMLRALFAFSVEEGDMVEIVGYASCRSEDQRCPHDGGKCHHECQEECFRKDGGMALTEPHPGYPLDCDEPEQDSFSVKLKVARVTLDELSKEGS